jgi:hypothetical protein
LRALPRGALFDARRTTVSDQSQLTGAIRDALPRTQFYRDLVALQQMGTAFARKVSEFWHAHDNPSVAVELMKMGVITQEQYGRDDYVMALLDESVLAVEDANGFLWALQQFVSVLESYELPDPQETGAETATEDDAPPCVVAGKEVV